MSRPIVTIDPDYCMYCKEPLRALGEYKVGICEKCDDWRERKLLQSYLTE